MAEPATDVGCESTVTMLYIATLESKSKDHWDECCVTVDRTEVSKLVFEKIPPKDAGKLMVRMKSPLLDDWFEACKVISETVASIGMPFRKDVFPELLDRLGFQCSDREALCASVDGFYTQLFNLRRRGKYIGLLSPCLTCPAQSPVHQEIVHMFHGLQMLLSVYEKELSLETAQFEQASSSGGVDSGGCAPEASHGAAAAATKEVSAAGMEYRKWLDPERLCEIALFKPLPDKTWKNPKYPSLDSWRACFGVIAGFSAGARLKQKAVTRMAIELAHFVNSGMAMQSEDLQNISTWVNAHPAGVALPLKFTSTKTLRVEVPPYLYERGHVTAPRDPRNISDNVQRAAREARSRATHRGMERIGAAVMVLQEQSRNVRSESAPSRSDAFIGESAIIPQECIPRLIGTGGDNIRRLQRELQVKLLVVSKGDDGSQCVRIEAATQAKMESAQRSLLVEVDLLLQALSGSKKARHR